jgi:hypothetical protein
LNDLWRFNTQTRNWDALAKGATARCYHCLEWDQERDQLILFGGVIGLGPTYWNDLWTYSIKSDQWQEVTPDGTSIPSGRYSHACAFNTRSLNFHVHGGVDTQYYQDLWQFNFVLNIWTLINAGNSNVQRFGHSMRYSKSLNSLLIFFGRFQLTDLHINSIYEFSFHTPSVGWMLFQVSGSQMLSGRRVSSTGFNLQSGEYLVLGGFDGASYLSMSTFQ